MDEALYAFLVESAEGLARLEEDLVALEQVPQDATLLASIFRSVHTIKGTCGFFGFNHVEALTHAAEDALAQLRDGRLALSRELTGALFELIDAVRHMLATIEEHGNDGEDDHAALVGVFHHFLSQEPQSVAPAVFSSEADRASVIADSAIRVDVSLLDKLMNVVGELVLTRNQIIQHAVGQSSPALASASQRLDLITTELQEGIMKTRMQPISTIWSAFPRLVRDLEVQTGKRVRLEREGGDTELDRSLLQAIKDPLTHLLRNAVDHGLETEAERSRTGKPVTGTIRLRAFHESGYVIVDISDDGRGIDTKAVLEKALGQGLVRPEQAARLGDRDIMDLLFLPGFSTAAQVTSISGRGVGLDVVRNNIERVGGSVDVQTRPGIGTTFKVRIPLTLAIIPALVTTCHSERYAIPQVNLLEIVRLDASDVAAKIESVHSSAVYRLRGKLLPLVDLRGILELPPRDADESVHILVLLADNREFGLIVDAVRDTEEIVVKPLGRHLKNVSCFAGATIMGDGRVALILDVVAIAQLAHVVNDSQQLSHWQGAARETVAEDGMRHSLLLFTMGDRGCGALPLSHVQRLEEFPVSAVEYSRGREVVQYRGAILPLAHLTHILELPAAGRTDGYLQVVVHEGERGAVGLVVDDVLDIVETEVAELQHRNDGDAVMGSLVVQGRVTDLIDMEYVMRVATKGLAARARSSQEPAHEQ